jgi:hypothetical protein
MTTRPIIFSAPMVRALIEGRKTQTRRVLKPYSHDPTLRPGMDGYKSPPLNLWQVSGNGPFFRLPFAPGDRLYVREAWQSNGLNWGKRPRDMQPGLGPVHYAATDKGEWQSYWGNWKPSIHMPRWASRLTLTVTDVKVQRLQGISTDDAIAEGISLPWVDGGTLAIMAQGIAKDGFRALWNSLHGPDAWDANPWVVALTFTVEHRNIDAGSHHD